MIENRTSRRKLLAAVIAFSAIASTITGTSMLRTSRAWAESRDKVDRETMDAMVRMARLLYPHDSLSDEFYAELLDTALSRTASNPSFADILNEAERSLDAAGPGKWIKLGEGEQLEVLREVEGSAFFAAIQGAVRAGIYLNPVFWKHIGYPGSSKERGGYVNRGSGDIEWLPGEP